MIFELVTKNILEGTETKKVYDSETGIISENTMGEFVEISKTREIQPKSINEPKFNSWRDSVNWFYLEAKKAGIEI
jgi:hypothetical protein